MIDYLTCSQLPRVQHCAASAVLPQAECHSAAAGLGTELHEYLERVLTIGRDQALDLAAPEHRDACASIPLDRLPVERGSVLAEATYALRSATGEARYVGQGLGRRYGPGLGDVVGTADAVGDLGHQRGLVLDWKTGWAELEAPAQHAQLRALAVLASRAHHWDRVTVGLVRVHPGQAPRTELADLDALDLGIALGEIREAHASVARGRAQMRDHIAPDVREGAWCRYCPAFAACPAKAALAIQLASGAPLATDGSVRLTASMAAACWHRITAIRGLVARVEERVREMARGAPIDLGDGRELCEVEEQRETLDGIVARDVLTRLYGSQVASEAIEPRTSKAAIERALRPLAHEPGDATALVREALVAIREAGGARTSAYRCVRECRRTMSEQEADSTS